MWGRLSASMLSERTRQSWPKAPIVESRLLEAPTKDWNQLLGKRDPVFCSGAERSKRNRIPHASRTVGRWRPVRLSRSGKVKRLFLDRTARPCLLYRQQFDLEDKGRVGTDFAAGSPFSVGKFGRNDQLPF